MFDILLRDLRYALRTLLARPGFTVAAVLTLALGIGANAAIFNVLETLLWGPLPYAHAGRLVYLYDTYPKAGEDESGTTIPDYLDQRAQAASLADAAIYQRAGFNLSADGAPERLGGLRATPSLFSTLGVSAIRGRVFGEADAVAGREHVAVLGYDTWQTRFAGDPAIVGRDVRLDGTPFRIIGVMPRGFFFPDRDVQIWIPYAITPDQRTDAARGRSDVESIGLLKPGATIAGLETEFRTITARNAARSPALRQDYAASGFAMHARDLRRDWFGGFTSAMWLLQAMVLMVLLIAGANVTSLLLVRFSARRRDFALRAALGADQGRLIGQLLAETTLLALFGGALGMLMARCCVPLIEASGIGRTLRAYGPELALGPAQFGVVLALSLFLGLGLGWMIALQSRRAHDFDLLRAGGSAADTSLGSRRRHDVLVIGQLALTLMLLVASGLLLKSFQRLLRTDPGFVATNLLTARLDPPATSYPDGPAQTSYYERLLTAAGAIPHVQTAAYTSSLPFDRHVGRSSYVAEDYLGADADALVAERQSVSDRFFTALGIPLVTGRPFDAGDSAGAPPVVIVDETLAQHVWPGQSAIGRRLRYDDAGAPWATVVGVARTVHQNDLAGRASMGAIYWPYRQQPAKFGEIVVKSSLPPAVLAPALRSAALGVDPQLPIYDIQTLDERIGHSLDRRRTSMSMLIVFGALALVLATIGIYGVLAYAVAQRTRELGVRMAIGARTSVVIGAVLASGLRLVAWGIAIGGVGALALGRLMQSQLYGVGGADPVVLAAAGGMLAAVALLACYLPARRAARVDPVVALRHE